MYEVVLVVQWLRELIRWQTFEIRRGPRFWARRSVCYCAGEEEMEGKDLKGGRMQPAREKGGQNYRRRMLTWWCRRRIIQLS